jgi:uncharacterized membrane protein YeiH
MTLFILADLIGIATFAYAGLLVGIERKLDLLGLIILAMLTALGGGMIRDLLVDRIPYALTHYAPVVTVLLTVALVLALRAYNFRHVENSRLFIISDAAGLSAFSIAGAIVGLDAGVNGFGVVLIGFVTAVGGGIIRDVLINRVPLLLRRDFYGTVAILVASGVWALDALGWRGELGLTLLFAAGVAVRLAAYFKGWKLPSFGA